MNIYIYMLLIFYLDPAQSDFRSAETVSLLRSMKPATV